MDRFEPPMLSTPSRREAAQRLARELGRQLQDAELALDDVAPDELVAAAEGAQDEPERLLWEERVVRQPELARRAAELAAFIAAARPGARRSLAARWPRRPTQSRWFAPLAAAAALLVALLLSLATPAPRPRPTSAATPPPAVTNRVLFANGFESGNLQSWSKQLFTDSFESGSLRDWSSVNTPRG